MATNLPAVGVRFQAQDVEVVQAAIRALVTNAQQAQKSVGNVGSGPAAANVGRLGDQAKKTSGAMQLLSRDGRSAAIALAFSLSQMASTGEASLKSLAQQIALTTSLLGGKAGVVGLIGVVGLGIFDFIQARARNAAEALRDTAIASARNQITLTKANLQQQDALNSAAYEQGVASLQQYYQQRLAVVRAGIQAEIAQKRTEAGALATPIPGENKKEANQRELQRKALLVDVAALERSLATQTIANDAARAAAERALSDKILGFRAKEEAIANRSTEARIAQVRQEAEEFRRALLQAGTAPDAAQARADSFAQTFTQQITLERQLQSIALLQQDIETRKLAVQQQVTTGKLSEADASRQIADLERASVPSLQQMVDLAIQFATALGDEGALANLKRIKVELGGMGVDVQMKAFANAVQGQIVSTISGAISSAFATIASGKGIAEGFKQLGRGFLNGFGGLLIMIGEKALAASALIKTIASSIAKMAPWIAIPAAIALIALGGAMQGAGGGGGGSGGGSSAGGGVSGGGVSASQIIYDPSILTGRRMRTPNAQRVTAAQPIVYNVIGAKSPAGQRLLGESNAQFNRRGGRG